MYYRKCNKETLFTNDDQCIKNPFVHLFSISINIQKSIIISTTKKRKNRGEKEAGLKGQP